MVSLLTGSDDQGGVHTNEDGEKQVDVKGIENALKINKTHTASCNGCVHSWEKGEEEKNHDGAL